MGIKNSPENRLFTLSDPFLREIVAASLALACGGIYVPLPRGNH
jgi:hypothetical protein